MTKTVNFAIDNVVSKPGSKDRNLGVQDMINERMKAQPELVNAYADMPRVDPARIKTFQDYAYAIHDQAEYLTKSMNEMRQMHESHFMTKKNKELMREKKALE